MNIQWIAAPKKLLFIFQDYLTLHKWLQNNKAVIIEYGGVIHHTTKTITFPNGNILWLGHAETEENKDKYLGLEYDTVSGCYNQQLKYRELTPRRF